MPLLWTAISLEILNLAIQRRISTATFKLSRVVFEGTCQLDDSRGLLIRDEWNDTAHAHGDDWIRFGGGYRVRKH